MTIRVCDNKITRVLAILTEGWTLTRFEALSHGDTALNSTISTLRNRHGLTVLGELEIYTGSKGSSSVMRYWIPEGEAQEKARRLLGFMRARARTKTAKGG